MVGAASHTVGSGFIFYLGVDDLLIEGITVDTYLAGLAFLVFGDGCPEWTGCGSSIRRSPGDWWNPDVRR